jgi:hypothetical protein
MFSHKLLGIIKVKYIIIIFHSQIDMKMIYESDITTSFFTFLQVANKSSVNSDLFCNLPNCMSCFSSDNILYTVASVALMYLQHQFFRFTLLCSFNISVFWIM